VGVALLVALLGWLLFVGRASSASVSDTIIGALAERRVMGPVPLRSVDAPPPRASAGDPLTHGADEFEVCGGAWVKAGPDGNVADEALQGLARREEVARAVERALQADPRPVARAARIVLPLIDGSDGSDDRRRALMASLSDCDTQACPQFAPPSRAAADGVAAVREALAQLALTANDAATYALAYRVCGAGRASAGGSCALISAEQWARLDPGNAAPWQEVFAAAQQRKDGAAANEALHRMATSQRSDQRPFLLPGLVADAAPQDDALSSGVLMLAMEAMSLQAMLSLPAHQPLVSACRSDALRDSNRRQTCEAIAELWADHADTLVERGMSGTLGGRLGWAEERIERMRAEQQVYAASQFAGIDRQNALGCESIKRMTSQLQRNARLGEVGAMREWLAREAPPPEELLRRYRAEKRESTERSKAVTAGQPASAASAAG
ncbi:MAG TPA: hypothetical protein VJN68_02950, partial [Burkholderiaceae bacterium]|nr:hypothetical protein [Burkholderiaceae bacterium]